jgi:hypothetical protein
MSMTLTYEASRSEALLQDGTVVPAVSVRYRIRGSERKWRSFFFALEPGDDVELVMRNAHGLAWQHFRGSR